MVQVSIGLPKKYRLAIVQRRRVSVDTSIFPSLEKIYRIRSGSKISRFFAHIFSQDLAKKIFGANIAFAIILTSFMPVKASFQETELNVITTQTLITKTEKGIQKPVAGEFKLNQSYWTFHPGLDIHGKKGDPIFSIMSGHVQAIQTSRFGYGNAILIDHGSGLTSLYGHLSKIEVKEGDEVTLKTEIGLMGSTGHSTGPHLHLEVHQDGRPFNPLTLLSEKQR
jgi:murein DD-endopeptidase MepM/ murein hydrolase activator NlpD